MTQAELSATYSKYLGRTLKPEEMGSLGGASGAWASMTPDQFAQNTIFPSQEFQGKYPGVSTEQGFGTAKGISDAKAVYDPITKSKNDLTVQQFDTLKQNITTQLGQSKEGVSSTLASRGLERSGELGWDTAQLETTANQQIGAAGLSATVQQAQNLADNWTQVYGAASVQEQALSAQSSQAFQNSLAEHQQSLTDLGFPIQQYSNVGQLWQGFLNSNIDPSQYQWIYEGLKTSMDKLGNIGG